MKAAVLRGKGRIVVEEVPQPRPGPGQVLIKVAYNGICGSDLHFLDFEGTPKGVILGHEWVGAIAELGAGVANWKVGDRVVMNGYGEPDRLTPEMIGAFLKDPTILFTVHPAVRSGGFGEYLVWNARCLLKVPDGLSDEEAALTDTIGVGMGAVRQSGMRIGDSAVVVGAGPIGLAAVVCAKAAGASKVFVTEMVPARKDVAAKLGADAVFDPSQTDVRLPVLMATGGGADVVLDCVGSPSTIQQSVDMVKTGGKVMLVGITTKPAQILPLAWMAKAVRFEASMQGATGQALELLAQKRFDAKLLITDKVPLADVQKAFDVLRTPGSQIKILVYP